VFIASPRAHWINGRNIPVDGLEQPHVARTGRRRRSLREACLRCHGRSVFRFLSAYASGHSTRWPRFNQFGQFSQVLCDRGEQELVLGARWAAIEGD
jgi:hypothetical protein